MSDEHVKAVEAAKQAVVHIVAAFATQGFMDKLDSNASTMLDPKTLDELVQLREEPARALDEIGRALSCGCDGHGGPGRGARGAWAAGPPRLTAGSCRAARNAVPRARGAPELLTAVTWILQASPERR